MRTPLTIEDYMEARYICRPLRIFDYCLINDGGVALILRRADLATDLKERSGQPASSGGKWQPRSLLIVGQVALSLVALIGAGLFVRSLSNLQNLDPGFIRESVLLVSVSPQSSGYQG